MTKAMVRLVLYRREVENNFNEHPRSFHVQATDSGSQGPAKKPKTTQHKGAEVDMEKRQRTDAFAKHTAEQNHAAGVSFQEVA